MRSYDLGLIRFVGNFCESIFNKLSKLATGINLKLISVRSINSYIAKIRHPMTSR
jgi:hypothetical protein